jgi:hypothetical protein
VNEKDPSPEGVDSGLLAVEATEGEAASAMHLRCHIFGPRGCHVHPEGLVNPHTSDRVAARR